MHKHRIFIIVAAALTAISTFLPWSTFNGGSFGSYSFSGIRGEFGWVIVVLAIGAIVLACLPNIAPPMNKNFSIGVIAIGILESLITIITLFRVLGASSEFGDGFSIGFGLIIAVIASIAIVVTGLLAMSGGKITKGTFQELASTSRGFAQSVASSVQSPQQPGQPSQQQWQQPQQGVWSACPRTRIPTSASTRIWSACPRTRLPTSASTRVWSACSRTRVPTSTSTRVWSTWSTTMATTATRIWSACSRTRGSNKHLNKGLVNLINNNGNNRNKGLVNLLQDKVSNKRLNSLNKVSNKRLNSLNKVSNKRLNSLNKVSNKLATTRATATSTTRTANY